MNGGAIPVTSESGAVPRVRTGIDIAPVGGSEFQLPYRERKMTAVLNDPWKSIRSECFGNVEPEVYLEAVTVPIGEFASTVSEDPDHPIWREIETLPAFSAGASYGSRKKLQDNLKKKLSLNRTLIHLGHHTPLESVQFNFHVTGISKACGSQVSRHRIGQGHVGGSRRFQEQQPAFVYPLLNYLTDEGEVRNILKRMSDSNRRDMDLYQSLRTDSKLRKEDARRVVSVASAQERVWWINARALRDFFRLRLAPDAEWEIRRLALMLYDIVNELTPSLFEDITIPQ